MSARQIGEGTTIEQQLDARRPASIQHLAAFPRLHRRGARTMLVAAARSPGTGLVPLGFGGGEDEDLDATVDAIEQPFGELSSPSLAGTLPIELAPPHDELDGSPIALIATSISELGLTTRVVPFDTTSALTVLEDFLPLAGATLDRATNTVAVHGLDSAGARTDLFRADLLRVELVGPRRTWRIYTPSTASFTLPALEEARAVLAAGPAPPPRVSITAAELADDYASLWDLRGQRIGRPDTVRAFSTHFADETR